MLSHFAKFHNKTDILSVTHVNLKPSLALYNAQMEMKKMQYKLWTAPHIRSIPEDIGVPL